ncbi:ras-related protein Rab-5C [Biomphalaria pfeifferi]|uniref:Ras-related protein Rab-5C n=1 Tax=Biomphalaria pfeifferi TaxID=112525 RepID=A0AAD8C5Y0_BIOPF|nr:ras-related protein Rab-5C [Biomphalaria pfeifferi]
MSESNPAPTRSSYRVVLLGDQGVGKSSISLRFLRDEFHEHNAPTIGAAYLTQTLKVGDKTVKLDLWDTAGQERFASLAPMYYRTAQGAIVVYDVCSKASFVRARDWVKELKTQAPAGTIVMLCGNKIDIPDGREVSIEDGVQMARDKGLIFAEVSAKSGQGVKSIFQAIAEKIVAKDSHSANSAPPQDKGIRLSSNEKASSGCRCSSQQTA